jgi:hypothetical protein
MVFSGIAVALYWLSDAAEGAEKRTPPADMASGVR